MVLIPTDCLPLTPTIILIAAHAPNPGSSGASLTGPRFLMKSHLLRFVRFFIEVEEADVLVLTCGVRDDRFLPGRW